jgi:uncharacterized membrane protein
MFKRVADTADFINAVIIAFILLMVSSVFAGTFIGMITISLFNISKNYEQVTFAFSVGVSAISIILTCVYFSTKENKKTIKNQ